MTIECNKSEKQAYTVPLKSELATKLHHYKVRMSGPAEIDPKFFIVRQLRDEKKFEEVVQELKCNGYVTETQCLGMFDKNQTKTGNKLVIFGSVWDTKKIIAEGIVEKLFLSKIILTTTELSPNDLLLKRHFPAKRYYLIKSGMDRNRLKTLQRNLGQDDELVEVK